MTTELAQNQWLLAYTRSSISERCWYASWLDNLEYVLWHSLENGPRHYGHDEITSAAITTLKILSDKCGCWIFFDDLAEETVIHLNEWQGKYTHHIENNPHALR